MLLIITQITGTNKAPATINRRGFVLIYLTAMPTCLNRQELIPTNQ